MLLVCIIPRFFCWCGFDVWQDQNGTLRRGRGFRSSGGAQTPASSARQYVTMLAGARDLYQAGIVTWCRNQTFLIDRPQKRGPVPCGHPFRTKLDRRGLSAMRPIPVHFAGTPSDWTDCILRVFKRCHRCHFVHVPGQENLISLLKILKRQDALVDCRAIGSHMRDKP